MTSPYATLVSTCEQLANDPKLPGFIVDWADELYVHLMDRTATVLVEDMLLLSTFADDWQSGLMAIDAALARRR